MKIILQSTVRRLVVKIAELPMDNLIDVLEAVQKVLENLF